MAFSSISVIANSSLLKRLKIVEKEPNLATDSVRPVEVEVLANPKRYL